MKAMNLADTIIMFAGFYFLVSTAMMKVHGWVNRMLISKKYDPEKARDLPGFILHRAIPVTSVVGYARKKGNSLHRGYNPAMKNKRSARMRTDAMRKMLTCL